MIPTKDFITALKFVSHASAKQDVRYYLNGVLFSFTNDCLTLVATDGHRLASVRLKTEGCQVWGDYIVPIDDVKRILTFTQPKDCNIYSAVAFQKHDELPNIIVIDFSNGLAPLIKCIDGKYPDWRKVVPSGEPTGTPTISLNANYVADACKALAGLSYKKSPSITLSSYCAATAVKLECELNPEFTAIEGKPLAIIMPVRTK